MTRSIVLYIVTFLAVVMGVAQAMFCASPTYEGWLETATLVFVTWWRLALPFLIVLLWLVKSRKDDSSLGETLILFFTIVINIMEKGIEDGKKDKKMTSWIAMYLYWGFVWVGTHNITHYFININN